MIIRFCLLFQSGFLWALFFPYDRMLSHVVKIQNPRRFPAGYPCRWIWSSVKRPFLLSKQSLSFSLSNELFFFRVSCSISSSNTIDQITALPPPLSIERIKALIKPHNSTLSHNDKTSLLARITRRDLHRASTELSLSGQNNNKGKTFLAKWRHFRSSVGFWTALMTVIRFFSSLPFGINHFIWDLGRVLTRSRSS